MCYNEDNHDVSETFFLFFLFFFKLQCLCDISENLQMSPFIRHLQGQEYLTRLDHSDFSHQHYFRMFYNAGVLLVKCLHVPCVVVLTFTGVLVMTYYPDVQCK